jgi:hypothetical protein
MNEHSPLLHQLKTLAGDTSRTNVRVQKYGVEQVLSGLSYHNLWRANQYLSYSYCTAEVPRSGNADELYSFQPPPPPQLANEQQTSGRR